MDSPQATFAAMQERLLRGLKVNAPKPPRSTRWRKKIDGEAADAKARKRRK